MARKPLRSQLNQIRAWVRQGRTDAWIAHQLEVPASELREFVRRHDLSADDEPDTDADLRDEIEAEIEATMSEEEEAEDEDEDEDEEEEEEEEGDDGEDGGAEGPDDSENGDGSPKRRRRRRGGRRRGGKRLGAGMQASFDHGDDEGYGLWIDPAIADDPVYTEHWAGHRKIEVTVEPDRIVIRRSEDEAAAADSDSDSDEE